MIDNIDSRAAWVEYYTGRTLTDFQRRAVVLLCRAMGCGPYDFKSAWDTAAWEFGAAAIFIVPDYGVLYTGRSDRGLTALLIGAHESGIQVGIKSRSSTHLRIEMTPRDKDYGLVQRHPTIEQAIADYRGRK